MAIGLFIEYRNQIVQLPVNPSELRRVKESDNTEISIVQLGDISRLGIAKLSECLVECFFPVSPNHAYVRTSGRFKPPNFYIEFLERIRTDRRPCRFVVTGTKINMMVSIEGFDYELKAGTDDIYYRLALKEFRNHSAKILRLNVPPPPGPAPRPPAVAAPARPSSTNQQIGIGSTVIFNGRLHRDSFGSGPGRTEKNAKRRVNFHQPGRRCPYHVTMLDGGWRGWVTADSVRLA